MVKVILECKCNHNGSLAEALASKELIADHVSMTGAGLDLWDSNDVLLDSVSFVDDKANQTRPFHNNQFWMTCDVRSNS